VSSQQVDVAIIGSGAGGLTSGLLLALTGRRVVVIERNRQPGGMMRSYRREGFDCPVGIHYLGALDEGQPLRRFFDAFGVTGRIPLERMGDGVPVDRYRIGDFSFELPSGLEAFGHALEKAFPGEGAATGQILADLRQAWSRMENLGFLFDSEGDRAPLKSHSAEKEFTSLGCSSELAHTLAMSTAWFGVPWKSCPISFLYMTLASYLASSWRLACSGARFADVLADRLRELGGEILCGDPCVGIDIESGAATGVRCASGRAVRAPVVVAAVHPQRMLDLLPSGAVKVSYANRIRGLENTGSAVCLQAAVPAGSHPGLPFNVLSWPPPFDERGIRFLQLHPEPGRPFSLLTVLKYGWWSEWERFQRREPPYREAKARAAAQLVAEAESLLGPLPGLRILDFYTPLTIQDWVDSPQGSAYGVMRSVNQRFQAALLNRTPVKGLFAAGQSVLAPGILGSSLGSAQTAMLIAGKDTVARVLALG